MDDRPEQSTVTEAEDTPGSAAQENVQLAAVEPPAQTTFKFDDQVLKAMIEAIIYVAPEPVTLDAIKQDPRLAKMVLVNNSRLSVQPVSDEEWKIIRAKGSL